MAVLATPPYLEFMDSNGAPLSGGKVYTYSAGTVTPKATYTDSTESTPNANPVILDSAGRANIWINGAYKFVVKDSSDVTIRTVDNITAFNTSSSSIDAILPSQAGNSGKFLTTNGTSSSWGADFASSADIISGTANKMVPAANFKSGLRGLESMTWLGDFTASSSASINITSKITSEFDEYIIKLIDVVPATDNVTLLFRTSANNGTSWDSGATDYSRSGNFNVSSNQTTSGGCATGESSLNLSGNVSNVSGRGLNATITLTSVSSGNRMRMGEFNVRYSNNVGDLLTYQGGWRRNATTHIDAIQFLMSSGNIASGIFRVYGLRKS